MKITPMNMKQFSAAVGVSAHTLRYYEKLGLLPDIGRNQSGHRTFSNRDKDWVDFILRLKHTDMPLSEIKRYADLRAQGDSTLVTRRQMLQEHAARLADKVRKDQNHLRKLGDKISYYDDTISTLDLE